MSRLHPTVDFGGRWFDRPFGYLRTVVVLDVLGLVQYSRCRRPRFPSHRQHHHRWHRRSYFCSFLLRSHIVRVSRQVPSVRTGSYFCSCVTERRRHSCRLRVDDSLERDPLSCFLLPPHERWLRFSESSSSATTPPSVCTETILTRLTPASSKAYSTIAAPRSLRVPRSIILFFIWFLPPSRSSRET